MNVEKALKELKENKGKIQISKERCTYWQKCLDEMTDEEIASEFIYESPSTYGMPKAQNNSSPVENKVIKQIVTREMVKQWIKDDQSRIRPLELEVKQIDIALGSLTEEEHFVIECKCIDRWKWRQVEIAFNERYRKEREITEERLKDIKENALKKMKKIIDL